MTDYLQGLFSYPGVQQWESFEITDVSGISPSIGILSMFPQFGLPLAEGDIKLTYGDNEIVFKNCKIDAASYQRNTGGQIVSVRFLDERWAWSFGQITGRYNIRKPNNFIDPDHEKTPRELARLCFAAMGVEDFSTSALPDDARPDIDWDHANPAQELAKLCDDLGCRIVPQRSKGKWLIVVTGEGADLPEDLPFNDAGNGFDPKERPDYIKIVTAPKKFQVALRLQPIGKDTDMSWKYIGDLSYKIEDRVDPAAFGFGRDYQQMADVSPTRVVQGDGTKISPQELALQTVFRCWRITGVKFGGYSAENIEIPGYVQDDDNKVTRKQVILSDELVQAWTDDRGGEHNRPAFIAGQFFGEKVEGPGENYPAGTRIDYQGNVYKDSEEERASFSIALDPIDTDRSIISTSKPLVVKDAFENGVFYFAYSMYLTCAVQIRDPDTWQPVRQEYFKQIGDGTNKDFCLEIVKDEIQPWWISKYETDFSGVIETTDNQEEVEKQCKYFADAIAKTFEDISTATRTYIGLYSIDLDGAIQQVSYRIGMSGADTIASRGTEHDFDIPQYAERRQRDGRKNITEHVKLVVERLDRLIKLQGTFNT